MAHAHRLDCEKQAADCRFIIQSENEDEVIEMARTHMRDVHGQDYTEEELRSEQLEVV